MATLIAEISRFDVEGNDLDGGSKVVVDIERPWTAVGEPNSPGVRISFDYGNQKTCNLEFNAVELAAALLTSRDHV